METALNKGCVKELVVAFERSQNRGVLSTIQKWTKENSKEITVNPLAGFELIHVRLPSIATLSAF